RLDADFIHSVRSQLPIRGKHADHRAAVEALVLGASIAAVGEALALGEALGLGRTPLLNMLEGSQLSPAVRAKRTNIESGHYPPSFKLRHAAKDLRLVIDAGAAVARDLKVSAAARAWLDAAVERG